MFNTSYEKYGLWAHSFQECRMWVGFGGTFFCLRNLGRLSGKFRRLPNNYSVLLPPLVETLHNPSLCVGEIFNGKISVRVHNCIAPSMFSLAVCLLLDVVVTTVYRELQQLFVQYDEVVFLVSSVYFAASSASR